VPAVLLLLLLILVAGVGVVRATDAKANHLLLLPCRQLLLLLQLHG